MPAKPKQTTENTPPTPVEPEAAPLLAPHVDAAPDVNPPADAPDEPTLEQRVAALEAALATLPAETERTSGASLRPVRTTGPGMTPPACPRCGADNNWLEVNLSDAVNVYRCRCGGRREVHA